MVIHRAAAEVVQACTTIVQGAASHASPPITSRTPDPLTGHGVHSPLPWSLPLLRALLLLLLLQPAAAQHGTEGAS
jgi:hypothetical protein